MCVKQPRIVTAEAYFKEVFGREAKLAKLRREGRKAYYCDMRTFEAHRQFASLFP